MCESVGPISTRLTFFYAVFSEITFKINTNYFDQVYHQSRCDKLRRRESQSIRTNERRLRGGADGGRLGRFRG